MGWALKNLSIDSRERIARSLFKVENVDGDWLNGLCPFHDDKMPSFGYNRVDDVFFCHASCTDSGDLVDLYCLVKGFPIRSREGFLAFKTAFAADWGLSQNKHKTPGQAQRSHTNSGDVETNDALKLPKSAPNENVNAEIPEEILSALLQIPEDMLLRIEKERGWAPEVIATIGIRVLSHYRRKSSLYTLFPIKERERVAIPIRDENGTLRNIRTYYPFGKPDTAPAKILSWGKGHGSSMLFPSPVSLQAGTVILCEGEGDCLCALSHGLNAITQTGKPDKWPRGHLEALTGRDVVIAYDADQPGEKYAQKAAKNLLKSGCTVRILIWPDFMGRIDGKWPEDHGQDLTDYFTKHGKSLADFTVLVEHSVPYSEEHASPSLPMGPYMAFFDQGVNGRLSFREKLLADYLIAQNTMLYHDMSGQLYTWEGTYFEPLSIEQLKRTAIDALGPETTASRINAVASIVMAMVSMPSGRDLNDQYDWACLQNGLLNLKTLEFAPHSPESMSTVKLGVRWHGDRPPKPHRWLKFLDQTVQTAGPIQQLQEYMGYCLTRDTRFGKALLMLGPGSDGKSKVIKVMREIVGPQNCSAVTMLGLEDQFQRAALFGKMLNVGAEVTTEAIQSEFFKNIVTGDPIQASFKHKDSFEFTPFCKLVYAMNKRPRVFDNSDGFFRRILPITFKRQFLENDPEMDTDLEEKLMEEIDGIFAWAVIGLHRLMQQKRFTACDETNDFILNYRRYNNPVMAFVQDQCNIEDSESEEDLKDLYKAYKLYCTEGGYRAVNRENFIEELQTATRKIRESSAVRCHRPRIGTQRPYMVAGIRLTSSTGVL